MTLPISGGYDYGGYGGYSGYGDYGYGGYGYNDYSYGSGNYGKHQACDCVMHDHTIVIKSFA